MTAVAELKNRLTDQLGLSGLLEIELPRLEQVGRAAGRSADESIDRLLGKSRSPIWPWIAAAVSLVVIGGMVALYVAWFRRAPEQAPSPITGWTPESDSMLVSELATSPLDS